MKNPILKLAIAATLFVGMTSCKKETMPKDAITQTLNVNLTLNENYTFKLPKNLRDDAYEITSQANHSKISQVGLNVNGEQVYQYTPMLNYTGNDQVIVSNDEERNEQHNQPSGPHQGDCKNAEEDHYIITINFTVIKKDVTSFE